MARELRQSTSVDLPIGPFLDSGDGSTAETALTITQPDVRLKKNGGAWAQKAAAQTLSHEENGNYEVTLDATDTDTLGLLRLHVAESGALPVWEDFAVVGQNYWDSKYGADPLEVDVVQLGGDAQSATDLKDFADAGYDPGTNKVQGVVLADTVTTYTGNTPQTGDSFARLGAPSGASIAADIATRLATAGYTAPDNATVAAIAAFVDTEIAAIKARTDLIPAAPAAVGDIPTVAQILTTAMTEAYAADGAPPTLAQALFLIMQRLTEFSISGTTISVKRLDGSTVAATLTLDSATTPTSSTRAT